MALIWADGFDDYDYDAAAPTASFAGEYESFGDLGSSFDIVTGGRRGNCLSINQGSGSNLYIQKNFPALSEVFVALATLNTSVLSGGTVLALRMGATVQVCFTISTTGILSAYRGTWTSGTYLGSSTVPIPLSTWAQLQFRVVISDTVGVIQVRRDGDTAYIINLTGIDTNNGASSAQVDSVALGGSMGISEGRVSLYDDFVIWDTTGSVMNTWAGDLRVDSILPNAEGDTQNFATSTGTAHFSLVNAASPVATSYTQGGSVGNVELFNFADISHTPSAIYGVMATAAALKDDAGARSVRMSAKSSSTLVDSGTDISLSTSRTRIRAVFETDPATSAAWTKTGLNAAQFGVKVTV
jgi:hypothetical protein